MLKNGISPLAEIALYFYKILCACNSITSTLCIKNNNVLRNKFIVALCVIMFSVLDLVGVEVYLLIASQYFYTIKQNI